MAKYDGKTIALMKEACIDKLRKFGEIIETDWVSKDGEYFCDYIVMQDVDNPVLHFFSFNLVDGEEGHFIEGRNPSEEWVRDMENISHAYFSENITRPDCGYSFGIVTATLVSDDRIVVCITENAQNTMGQRLMQLVYDMYDWICEHVVDPDDNKFTARMLYEGLLNEEDLN